MERPNFTNIYKGGENSAGRILRTAKSLGNAAMLLSRKLKPSLNPTELARIGFESARHLHEQSMKIPHGMHVHVDAEGAIHYFEQKDRPGISISAFINLCQQKFRCSEESAVYFMEELIQSNLITLNSMGRIEEEKAEPHSELMPGNLDIEVAITHLFQSLCGRLTSLGKLTITLANGEEIKVLDDENDEH